MKKKMKKLTKVEELIRQIIEAKLSMKELEEVDATIVEQARALMVETIEKIGGSRECQRLTEKPSATQFYEIEKKKSILAKTIFSRYDALMDAYQKKNPQRIQPHKLTTSYK